MSPPLQQEYETDEVHADAVRQGIPQGIGSGLWIGRLRHLRILAYNYNFHFNESSLQLFTAWIYSDANNYPSHVTPACQPWQLPPRAKSHAHRTYPPLNDIMCVFLSFQHFHSYVPMYM